MILFGVAAIVALGVVANMSSTSGSGSDSKEINPFFAWDNLIRKYSSINGVPFEWMKAIMITESNLGRAKSVAYGLRNPTDINGSKSSDGKSWGLMQLTLPTARMFESAITEVGLNDPEVSVRIAGKYLGWLMKKNFSPFSQQEFVVRAYNGGPGFMGTVAGRRDTPAYYQKFLSNLIKVQNGG